ncbi:MAG TPA: Fe-Mn family superoxide dismutase [Burkholderiales bacterium]|nr:Fe-Mn family superoxide dismutase [Burkholderiales bacterium]
MLVCDVWEHAYYIDCRNGRSGQIGAFEKAVDRDFASRNFET